MVEHVSFPDSTTVRVIRSSLRGLAMVRPKLAARAATYLFFRTPPRRKPQDHELDAMSWARPFLVPYASTELRAWRWGEGPTIALIHGWGGSGGQLASFVRPLVEAGFEVVTIDFPGHGTSPGTRTSIPEMADVVVALHRQLGGLQGIIAHSLGVPASLLALDRGVEVGRIAAVAGPARPLRWYEAWVGAVVDRPTFEAERQRMERELGVSMHQLDIPQIAPQRTERLLWVHDRNDKEVPLAAGLQVPEAWQDAEVLVTEGLGHKRILKDDAVVARVVAFHREGSVEGA